MKGIKNGKVIELRQCIGVSCGKNNGKNRFGNYHNFECFERNKRRAGGGQGDTFRTERHELYKQINKGI